jgi:hypothetical protein
MKLQMLGLVGIGLFTLGCPPSPGPDEKQIETQKAIENAVLVFESMVADAVVMDCVRTREIWNGLDVVATVKAAKDSGGNLTDDQLARYQGAVVAVQKVLEACRDKRECPQMPECTGDACAWLDCIEWSYECTDSVEACCLAEACAD